MQIEDILGEAADAPSLRLRCAFEIEHARLVRNLTQKQLAERMGTKQPSIARAERGTGLPSLTFLKQMAEALGTELIEPRFAFLHEREASEPKRVMSASLARTRSCTLSLRQPAYPTVPTRIAFNHA